MKVQAGYKFRLYPNAAQRAQLAKQFGHCRFVYNRYRALREQRYQAEGRTLSYRDCAADLTRLKRDPEFAWLKEADSQALQQALWDPDSAYQRFFKQQAGYPRFKSRRSRQSYRYPQRFRLSSLRSHACQPKASARIYLPKVGWVRLVKHRELPGEMKSCTVSKTKTGQYFVSILCEFERAASPATGQIGIDLGLTHLATLSTGQRLENPRPRQRTMRRLQIRQRRLSRKQPGSRNREKARRRVAQLHERVSNQRRDTHHQVSRKLVDRYGLIALETLHIRGLLKNRRLAGAIGDAGWGQLVTFLTYKLGWAGGRILRVDRWFASTRTCSTCGQRPETLPLSVRKWQCEACGTWHDRDINAGNNILKQALRSDWVEEATVGATGSHALGEMRPVGVSAQEAQ